MSKYKVIEPDTIFSLNDEYQDDKRTDKINASIGIYLDNDGKTFVIPTVAKVVSELDRSNFNYLPIKGDLEFIEESTKLVLGDKLYKKYNHLLAKQGVTGGTNGIYVWANLIALNFKKPTIILSDPTWDNHNKIFKNFGFKIIHFPQLNKNKKFNFTALKKAMRENPNAFILFQGGPTHNPTCVNPSEAEWVELTKLFKKYNNTILLDSAYIGLGDDFETDCFSGRYLLENKIKMAINFSFSKNMTLYQHRTSLLIVLAESEKERFAIDSCLNYLFRISNSTPPAFGEPIVKKILTNKTYKKEWLQSLAQMSKNLKKRRELFNKLTKGRFSYVLEQKGFFSLLDLTSAQITLLKTKYGIYLLQNGRINFGGMSLQQIPVVAKAILSIINN